MAQQSQASAAPIILVPGFWLGAWAWDGVSEEQKETFRRRAVPVPGGVLRE